MCFNGVWSDSVTTRIKSTEHFFSKLCGFFEWMTILLEAFKKYFFLAPYLVVITLYTVITLLINCDHGRETHWKVHYFMYDCVLFHALPVGFNFWARGCNQLSVWPFNWLFFTSVENLACFLDFLATVGDVNCDFILKLKDLNLERSFVSVLKEKVSMVHTY